MPQRIEKKCPDGTAWSQAGGPWDCWPLPLGQKMMQAIGGGIVTPEEWNKIKWDEVEKKEEETKHPITRTAEYVCKSRIRGETDRITELHKVSVTPVSSESAEALDRRLRQAAEELKKTIRGCHDVRFAGFRETPPLQTGAAPSTITPSPEAVAKAVAAAKAAQDAYEKCLKKAGPTACSR